MSREKKTYTSCHLSGSCENDPPADAALLYAHGAPKNSARVEQLLWTRCRSHQAAAPRVHHKTMISALYSDERDFVRFFYPTRRPQRYSYENTNPATYYYAAARFPNIILFIRSSASATAKRYQRSMSRISCSRHVYNNIFIWKMHACTHSLSDVYLVDPGTIYFFFAYDSL